MAVTISRNRLLTVIDDQIVHRLLAEIAKTVTGVPLYLPTQRVVDEQQPYGRVRAMELLTGRHERLQTGEDRMPVRIVVHVQHTQVGGDGADRGAARLHHAAAVVRRQLTGVIAVDTRTIAAESSSTGEAYESTHELELHRAVARDLLNERFEPQGVVQLEVHGMAKRLRGRDTIAAGGE
ncbi:MAG: hypothetical protein AAFR96_09340 [Planctomycetota bacterium]